MTSGDDGLEWAAAMGAAAAAASALPLEHVALGEGVGRVLGAALVAVQDIPHFASSAMDGWAVNGSGPWRIVDGPALAVGEAVAVLTGQVVPATATGVLRSEWGDASSGETRDTVLSVSPRARPGEPGEGSHIRTVATEAAAGAVLIAAGTRLNPAHIAIAAAAGHDQATVARRPRVAILLTGDEVIAAGVPGLGQIRDSFGPQLPSLFSTLGCVVSDPERVPDSLAVTITAIDEASRDSDLIVTTGGTGDSDADHIRPALAALGATMVVPGIAVRPGSPTLLARLPGGCMVAGLPGNPLAAMMGVLLVARPVICGLKGAKAVTVASVTASADISGSRAVRLMPYRMTERGAAPAELIGPAMMRGLAESDGVLVVPRGGVRQGERVQALPLPWSP